MRNDDPATTAASVPQRARRGPGRPAPTGAEAGALALGALALLWPALRNGYPLVFSDTGTYLSQAIQHYLGWDRPVFYSLFLLALHWQRTTWPPIAAQALLAAGTIRLTQRCLCPTAGPLRFLALIAVLAVATPLPIFVSELMPDLFTGLLALALTLLVLVPDRLTRPERLGLTALAAFAMAAHLSSLPLGLGLLAVLAPCRQCLGATAPLGRAGRARLAAAPLLAAAALVSVNLIGFGRASLAPFGNVFLLARVLYDGPGMDALRHDCPHPGWRLCRSLGHFPTHADGFLWRADSPLQQAGGAKQVSREADSILRAALRAEPGRELRAALANTLTQLTRFQTGDGLHPWPTTVTPWIQRDFPKAEQHAYANARQTKGLPVLPPGLIPLHTITTLAALLACLALLPRTLRRHHPASGLICATLLTLTLNAAITGSLSGPHPRYQNRITWLPTLAALLAWGAVREREGDRGMERKARGLCPLDPHQGLSPWNHWGLRQEGGATLPLEWSE